MTRLASGALGAPGTPSVEHLDDLEPTDARDPSREADGDVEGMQQGDAEQGPQDGNVEADLDTWRELADRLAGEGHKVIACASRTIDTAGWVGGEPDRGFRIAGLLAFEDPVRRGVAAAVAACRRAGIRTLMVTGDHPGTATAVAREIGLSNGAPRVLVADEVGNGSDGSRPLPIRIVRLELVMHPTALLVFQETAPAGDPEPPRREAQARFFDRRQWVAIVGGGILLTAAVAAGFVRSVGILHDVEHGRAMALATLTLASAALTATLSRLSTPTARLMTLGTVGLSLAPIQSRAAGLLHLRPLHADDWALAAAVAAGAALTTPLSRTARRVALETRPS